MKVTIQNKKGLHKFMLNAKNLKELNLLKSRNISFNIIEKYKAQNQFSSLKIIQKNRNLQTCYLIDESLYIADE